jgi:hypothetical protein
MKTNIFKFFIILFVFISVPVFSASNKDVILILDTSLSMIGQGGENIFENVKSSIKTYIDNLKDGDRVTFATFDETVKIYPTVLVDDKNDRDILKKFISVTEAKGKWTYTFKMMSEIFARADEIEKEKNGRQLVIVIMTDSIDDPPPANVNEKLLIKEIASKYGDKNSWWIFLVGLNELKSNQKLVNARQKLSEQLSAVSKNTYRIETDGNVKDAIEKNLKDDINKLEWKKKRNMFLLIGISSLVLIIIILILIVNYFSKLKIKGRLEYWNNTILSPYITTFKLTRFNLRKILVGRNVECNLNLHELNISEPFVLSAVKSGNGIAISIQGGHGYEIQMINRQYDGYILDGDIFKVENFTFKYFNK